MVQFSGELDTAFYRYTASVESDIKVSVKLPVPPNWIQISRVWNKNHFEIRIVTILNLVWLSGE